MRSASWMVEIRCETISVVRSRRMSRRFVEDLFLGVGIDGGERIVEDQNARIAHHGAGAQ